MFIENDPEGSRDILPADKVMRRPSIAKLTDAYSSVFYYGDDLCIYATSKAGSVRGFKGPHFARGLHWDIDCETDLGKAQESAITLLRRFDDYGVDPAQPVIFFSGNKGFHVLLWDAFNIPAGPDASRIVKRMCEKIADGIPNIDSKVYATTQLWRMANTINGKTGLYKVRLSAEEIELLTPDGIKNLAREPREPQGIKALRCDLLQRLCDETVREMAKPECVIAKPKMGSAKYRRDRKMCIQKLMNGTREGNRNAVGHRLAVHWKKELFGEEETTALLSAWNRRNAPPLPSEDIIAIVDSAYEGEYDYGCNDDVLKAHCFDDCMYRKKKSAGKIYTLDDAAETYIARTKREAGITLGMVNIDNAIGGINPGQVMGFYAKTGTGKTAWAMNAMEHVGKSGRGTLFFSIEMPKEDVFERAAQMTFRSGWRVIENWAKLGKLKPANVTAKFGNLRLVDAPTLTHEELAVYVERARESSPVDFVVLDYLGRMDGPGKSVYERVSKLAERMKDQAKALEVPILFLGQLNNQAVNIFSRVELGMLRDSGVQAESCDYICGAWRNDDAAIFRVELLKGRRAATGILSDYSFMGDTMEMYCRDPEGTHREE